MNFHSLQRPGPPWAHLLVTDSAAAEPALKDLHGPAVKVVRGPHCRTAKELFAEMAAALELPAHFGHNWDALADSVGDLGTAHPHGVVVVVTRPAELLTLDPPESLSNLAAVMARAAAELARPRASDWGKPLHLVLIADEGAADEVERRWHEAGVELRRMP